MHGDHGSAVVVGNAAPRNGLGVHRGYRVQGMHLCAGS